MSRWQFMLSAAVALTLLTGGVSFSTPLSGVETIKVLPVTGQAPATVAYLTQTPPAEPTPSPSLPGQDRLHVVSLYSTRKSQGEEASALHDYAIRAQEFIAPNRIFRLPVAALGRKVSDVTKPGPLPTQGEAIPWRLYIPGDNDRSEITCSTEAGLFWQEVFAILNSTEASQNVYAYSVPVAEICFMPANTSTRDMVRHARNSQVWIDAAVFDLGHGHFDLFRFVTPGSVSPLAFPAPPHDPMFPPIPPLSGSSGCRTVCSTVHCNSPLGCFLHMVCTNVCR